MHTQTYRICKRENLQASKVPLRAVLSSPALGSGELQGFGLPGLSSASSTQGTSGLHLGSPATCCGLKTLKGVHWGDQGLPSFLLSETTVFHCLISNVIKTIVMYVYVFDDVVSGGGKSVPYYSILS